MYAKIRCFWEMCKKNCRKNEEILENSEIIRKIAVELTPLGPIILSIQKTIWIHAVFTMHN